MPQIHYGSVAYKTLNVTKKLTTSNIQVDQTLSIYDSKRKSYSNLKTYIFDELDMNYGIPGVIRGPDVYTRLQIVTPNDLSNNCQHIYKHVLNGAHLTKIELFNSSKNIIPFGTMDAIYLNTNGIQNSITYFHNSYNKLKLHERFAHTGDDIVYLDINGDFSDLEHGILTWKTKFFDMEPNILGISAENIYIEKTIEDNIYNIPNISNVFNLDINSVLYNHGYTLYCKCLDDDENILKFSNIDSNITITPNSIYYKDVPPLDIIISVKNHEGEIVSNSCNIKLKTIDAIIVLSEHFNSNSDIYGKVVETFSDGFYSFYNSSSNSVTIFEFRPHNKILYSSTNLDPNTKHILHSSNMHISFSYNTNSLEYNEHISIRHLKSSNTTFTQLKFTPYTIKPEYSNSQIHYQSFLQDTLDYFTPHYSTNTHWGMDNESANLEYFNSHKHIQLPYTSVVPIGNIYYKTNVSAMSSYFTYRANSNIYTSDNYTDSSTSGVDNTLTHLPFIHNSLSITVKAEDSSTQSYTIHNSYKDNSPHLYMLNSNSQITIWSNPFVIRDNDCDFNSTLNKIDNDGSHSYYPNSFVIHVVSFYDFNSDTFHVNSNQDDNFGDNVLNWCNLSGKSLLESNHVLKKHDSNNKSSISDVRIEVQNVDEDSRFSSATILLEKKIIVHFNLKVILSTSQTNILFQLKNGNVYYHRVFNKFGTSDTYEYTYEFRDLTESWVLNRPIELPSWITQPTSATTDRPIELPSWITQPT